MKSTSEIISEQVLRWAKQMKGQRFQTAILESLKESKILMQFTEM